MNLVSKNNKGQRLTRCNEEQVISANRRNLEGFEDVLQEWSGFSVIQRRFLRCQPKERCNAKTQASVKKGSGRRRSAAGGFNQHAVLLAPPAPPQPQLGTWAPARQDQMGKRTAAGGGQHTCPIRARREHTILRGGGGGGGWGRPAQPYTRIYGDLKHRIPQGVPQPGAKYLGTWEQSRPSADAGQPPPQWAGRERKRQAGPQTHQRSQAQRWMVVNAGPVQDRLRDGACQTEY